MPAALVELHQKLKYSVHVQYMYMHCMLYMYILYMYYMCNSVSIFTRYIQCACTLVNIYTLQVTTFFYCKDDCRPNTASTMCRQAEEARAKLTELQGMLSLLQEVVRPFPHTPQLVH